MSDETETTEVTTEATTTEPAAVQAEPPLGFTQKQVDEIVSREKRKWRSQSGKKVKETTPAPITDAGPSNAEVLATLELRDWAEDKGLNRDQREYAEAMFNKSPNSSWDEVYEAKKGQISRLGAVVEAAPATEAPAPKQPMTAEAPGTATNQTRQNPMTMSAADIRGTSREERDKLWEEHQAANGGSVRKSLFTPRLNGRGKGNG